MAGQSQPPPPDLQRTSTPVENRSSQNLLVDIHNYVGDEGEA